MTSIATIISEIVIIVTAIIPIVLNMSKISNGTRCQLRSEMLRIYYKNVETKEIRQYEFENFVMLYEAYKALKGNSFVDKIYEDVKEWKVIS